MRISFKQAELLARYFSDISKIVFASTIVGFFVPEETRRVTISIFLIGAVTTIAFLLAGLKVVKPIKS